MEAVGKYFVLLGKIGAARFHQIDAGEIVFPGDGLCPEMFFNRERVVSAALHGSVVADDDTLLSGNAAQVPGSPLESLRTLTAHIALVHSSDTQAPAYASIFAAGLLLLVMTAGLSLAARVLAKNGLEAAARATRR